MTFKAFGKLELGKVFKHRGQEWAKVPEMRVDDIVFNAYTLSPHTENDVGDKIVHTALIDEAVLVDTDTEVDPEKEAQLKALFAGLDKARHR